MNRREREFQDWQPCPMLSGSGYCLLELGHSGPHEWHEPHECRTGRPWDLDTEDERRESEYAGWFGSAEQTWLDRRP
jgi:hypothetical protein